MCGDLRRQRAKQRREPILGGLHQRAMKGCAHGERNHPLGAGRLRQLSSPRDGIGMAGDHDLPWRVQVGRRYRRGRQALPGPPRTRA